MSDVKENNIPLRAHEIMDSLVKLRDSGRLNNLSTDELKTLNQIIEALKTTTNPDLTNEKIIVYFLNILKSLNNFLVH